MKKLIIQIPCYNEKDSIGVTLDQLPREVPGIDVVEWLIIDDGSVDDTAQEAREHGADHILSLPGNKGLAKAFMAGIDEALRLGADVIVNTDGDNQYCADDIPKLVAPILEGKAEMVIGARPIAEIEHFPLWKKFLQKLGSRVVRLASRTTVPDAPSGFRAVSRAAAMRLNVFNEYTYTLETIIQAGHKNITVVSVPIRVNEQVLRPSRLFHSVRSYLWRSAVTIARIFITYRPFRFFATLGTVIFLIGFLIGLRFVLSYFIGQGGGKIQSLILASLLMGSGFFVFLTAILADLIAVNRKLLEQIDYRLRLVEEQIDEKLYGPEE